MWKAGGRQGETAQYWKAGGHGDEARGGDARREGCASDQTRQCGRPTRSKASPELLAAAAIHPLTVAAMRVIKKEEEWAGGRRRTAFFQGGRGQLAPRHGHIIATSLYKTAQIV